MKISKELDRAKILDSHPQELTLDTGDTAEPVKIPKSERDAAN